MAGTDRTQASLSGGPPVVLCRPQLGENIGVAARAMLNCGLGELRLVAPSDGWDGEKTRAAASGADVILDSARVFARLEDAIADLTQVFAATARPRDRPKPGLAPRAAAARLRALVAAGGKPGLLLGPEREGLTNDELALADTIVTARLNPAFSSLNLGQAVLLLGYAWLEAGDAAPQVEHLGGSEPPAPKSELLTFLERFEADLDACGFLSNVEQRPALVRNLRDLFQRATPTSRELRTLHGAVRWLAGKRER
jgi:tRNA/rRNA methyltransferase